MKMLVIASFALLAVGVLMTMPLSYANTQTTTTPLGDQLSLEKTTTALVIPETNMLPWGYVTGTVDNPVEGYPVIIQFFQGGVPVHIAQVDVDNDGTYNYKFRILDVVEGQTINVFEGDYTVKIFKVVQNQTNMV